MTSKSKKKYICIHGHFYQPIRTNPWLEHIELQEDAYPFHDWNEKICAECYRSNAGSHILGVNKKISEVVNNYESISFNFGSSLLNWIRVNDKYTYRKIIEADIKSRTQFDGHGSAIAQIYNHIIMPLSADMDREVQVWWAIKDFEFHFNRKPEGIWLSETAVDYRTLEILAENEILFTILSPNQAKRVRRIIGHNPGARKPEILKEMGDRNPAESAAKDSWTDVSNGTINTRMPYLCTLPDKKSIYIFFYDNSISNRISFGNLLEDGKTFAKTLIEAPPVTQEIPEITVIATDGETFGHHHKFGDMALAYAINKIKAESSRGIIIFGAYLEKYKPTHEVEIIENSSWSCSHGTCRWKDDCGCSTGNVKSSGFNQKWRTPLRKAVDRLSSNARKNLADELKNISPEIDPLSAAKDYINIINSRGNDRNGSFYEKLDNFLNLSLKLNAGPNSPKSFQQKKFQIKGFSRTGYGTSADLTVRILKIFEMYRNSLLMQSSDGWFFDDISGIEPVQNMRYAYKTIQLIKDLTGNNLEEDFTGILSGAESNIREFGNGKDIFNKYVKTAAYNYEKIATHFAFAVLNGEDLNNIFVYEVEKKNTESFFSDSFKVATGSITIKSKITLERCRLVFCSYIFNFNMNNHVQNISPGSEIKNNWPIAFVKTLSCNSHNKSAFIYPDTGISDKDKETGHVIREIKEILKNKTDILKRQQTDKKNILYDEQVHLMGEIDKKLHSYFRTNRSFNSYNIKDLIKDNQVELSQGLILKETEKIRPVLEKLFENYEEITKDFKQSKVINYFLDGIFGTTEEFIGEIMLYSIFKREDLNQDNIKSIKKIIDKIDQIDFINRETFNKLSTQKINGLVEELILKIDPLPIDSLSKIPENFYSKDIYNATVLIKLLIEFIDICRKSEIIPNLWQAQNLIYESRAKIKKFRLVDYKEKDADRKVFSDFKKNLDILAALLDLE